MTENELKRLAAIVKINLNAEQIAWFRDRDETLTTLPGIRDSLLNRLERAFGDIVNESDVRAAIALL